MLYAIMHDGYNKNNKNVFLSFTNDYCCQLSRFSLKSPVVDFDLWALGVALQSPVYGANCSCVKKHYLTILT